MESVRYTTIRGDVPGVRSREDACDFSSATHGSLTPAGSDRSRQRLPGWSPGNEFPMEISP